MAQKQHQELLVAKEIKRQHLSDKKELQKAKELAKKKNIVLEDEPFKPGKINCKDCKKLLPEPNWFAQEILFDNEPMIKYWLVWSGLLKPVAYSRPTSQKEYICPSCFDDLECRTRKKSLETAAKLALQLMKNPQKD